MDISIRGIETLMQAFAKGSSTDDFKNMFLIHQKLLDIKNLMQDEYDLQTDVNYIDKEDNILLEINIHKAPRHLSKEQMDALKDFVGICDDVYKTAKSIKTNKK